MAKIFNKQTVLYLVIAIAISVFASLAFFTWRDGKLLSTDTDVSQGNTVESNESAHPKREPTTSYEKPLHSTASRTLSPRKINRVAKLRHRNNIQIQVDQQKVMSNLIKYEGLFEKSKNLEVNAEDIIRTGE